MAHQVATDPRPRAASRRPDATVGLTYLPEIAAFFAARHVLKEQDKSGCANLAVWAVDLTFVREGATSTYMRWVRVQEVVE